MKKVLRSLMWSDPADRTVAEENFLVLKPHVLIDMTPDAQNVLNFCTDFFLRHQAAPMWKTVRDHFDATNAVDELILVDEVEHEQVYTGADFKAAFEAEIESQATSKFKKDLREAQGVATQKGVREAVSFVHSNIEPPPRLDDQIPVSLQQAKTAILNIYDDRATNVNRQGIGTGYEWIDTRTGGLYKKQLYIHAGFIGHLKSTFALNVILNSAIDHKWNCLLFITEMPKDDVMMMMAAIHSAHPKFQGQYMLDSFNMLRGRMTQQERQHMELIWDDINDPANGSIRIIDNNDFRTFSEIQARTLQEHMKEQVDVLWVDYLTRLTPEPKYIKLGMRPVDARNEMLADAKRFAMTFDNGEGLAVCSPFQVNREGLREAKKNEGKLSAAHLFQYNNAEKEADLITYIWFEDEEKATNQPKVGFIKNRYGKCPSDPSFLFLDEKTRRIFSDPVTTGGVRVSPTTGQLLTGPGGSDEPIEQDVVDPMEEDGECTSGDT